MAYSRIPQLAQLASNSESKSHSIRFRFPPRSIAAVHFRQKRISFIQCPVVNTGTSTASGDNASLPVLSMKRHLTVPTTHTLNFPPPPSPPPTRLCPSPCPPHNSSTV